MARSALLRTRGVSRATLYYTGALHAWFTIAIALAGAVWPRTWGHGHVASCV